MSSIKKIVPVLLSSPPTHYISNIHIYDAHVGNLCGHQLHKYIGQPNSGCVARVFVGTYVFLCKACLACFQVSRIPRDGCCCCSRSSSFSSVFSSVTPTTVVVRVIAPGCDRFLNASCVFYRTPVPQPTTPMGAKIPPTDGGAQTHTNHAVLGFTQPPPVRQPPWVHC